LGFETLTCPVYSFYTFSGRRSKESLIGDCVPLAYERDWTQDC